jgi:hemerythrin-like domain-containing protein
LHDLISRLSSEHLELEQALSGIRPRQFRTDEGRTRLDRVRTLLRNHTSEEEKELFPLIAKAAAADERIANHFRMMTSDLRILTGLAEDFFHKYENGEIPLVEFATDHGALLTILRIRLRREETTLFPLYENLIRN